MADFHVPDSFARFSIQVERRFVALVQKRVLTGINMLQLRSWWCNFESDEERYLAAHLLDSLIFRTDQMLWSSSRHVLQMMLPNILNRLGRLRSLDLQEFLGSLTGTRKETGIRFVAVDGTFAKKPKSGGELMRLFARATGLRGNLQVRPEHLEKLPDAVKVLVFLDDCLGTGTQFEEFSRFYKLENQAKQRHLIYLPFVAHSQGVSNLKRDCPWLVIEPVETVGQSADFYFEDKEKPGIWNRDKSNHVDDVREFYSETMKLRGASGKEGDYCLNLSLGFESSTPNNTLKAFFSNEGDWSALLIR